MGCVRPGRRYLCDAVSSWTRMALGNSDRNCGLLLRARGSDSLSPVVPSDGHDSYICCLRRVLWSCCTSGVRRWTLARRTSRRACGPRSRVGGGSRRQEIRTFATTTNALLELRDWLVAEQVTLVVTEATGDYWRAPFYLLEDVLNVILVNAAHAKGLPGRRRQAGRGVVGQAQRTRHAASLVRAARGHPPAARLHPAAAGFDRDRTRHKQRMEELLEDALIKLSTVATGS